MPHLRFTKDRRGYEQIALVQEARRKGRDRNRVLYVFRTPPGVRIGRDAFDPATLELIERANPDVLFDWDAILEARPAVPEEEEPVRRGKWRTGSAGPGASPGDRGGDRRQAPAVVVPTLDRVLGRDTAMRLRQRFAAVRQRVDEGTGLDPERQASGRERLAGLDPDSWADEETVRARAAGFDGAIEEIRRLLGLPKRRSRRSGRREDQAGVRDGEGASAGEPDDRAAEDHRTAPTEQAADAEAQPAPSYDTDAPDDASVDAGETPDSDR